MTFMYHGNVDECAMKKSKFDVAIILLWTKLQVLIIKFISLY